MTPLVKTSTQMLLCLLFFRTTEASQTAVKVRVAAKPQVVGLHNPNNRCYLNASLQALYHIPHLSSFLQKLQQQLHHPYRDGLLSETYVRFANAYAKQNLPGAYHADIVYDGLKDLRNRDEIMLNVGLDRQEDVTEFLSYLLPSFSDNLVSRGMILAYVNPFEFRDTKLIVCPSCRVPYIGENESYKFSTQLAVALSKKNNEKTYNLASCISKHFEPKEVVKKCRFNCSPQNMIHTQRVSFQQAPNILCISLKRFEMNDQGQSVKMQDYVDFPEQLDMTAFMAREDDIAQYDLVSCIMHRGHSIESGHYVAYVKKEDGWYLCDDAIITKMNPSFRINQDLTAQKETAYVFFYQKQSQTEREQKIAADATSLSSSSSSSSHAAENIQQASSESSVTANPTDMNAAASSSSAISPVQSRLASWIARGEHFLFGTNKRSFITGTIAAFAITYLAMTKRLAFRDALRSFLKR